MDNVTFIIKTYERFYCVKRLVKSIYKKYPNAKVLIADDSTLSCKSFFNEKYPDKDIKVYELENDCGLSAGRNYLVDRVKTEYFVLLDDDFVFDKKTDVKKAEEIIIDKNLDILGGYIRNYTEINNIPTHIKCLIQRLIKYEKPANYLGTINYDKKTKTLQVDYKRKEFPLYTESDIVLNFFIARTNVVRDRNRWDDELKLQEHTAFFYTAKKNGLRVGFSNEFSVQHRPIKLKAYGAYRGRNFTKVFMKKNDIDRIIATYDNGEVQITNYEEL